MNVLTGSRGINKLFQSLSDQEERRPFSWNWFGIFAVKEFKTHKIMNICFKGENMKRYLLTGLVLIFALTQFGCSSSGDGIAGQDLKPVISVPGSLKLDKKGKVGISGKGFPSGSEVMLLFTTNDGVQADIGYALEPAPVVSKDGDWNTEWSYGRFVAKKLVNEGSFELAAVDEDFNPLCTLSIQFVK